MLHKEKSIKYRFFVFLIELKFSSNYLIKRRNSRNPAFYLSLLFTTIILCNTSQAQINEGNAPTSNLLVEDYELIIDFYFGQRKLNSNVFIYTPPEATLIPLQPIFDALEFPIEVDPVSMTAHGWFIDENNSFDLDVKRKRLFIRNTEISLKKNPLIFSDGFDIFVDLALLQQWLPITLQLETSRLRLNISSKEKLPFEIRYLREKQRKRALHQTPTKSLDIIKDEYQWLGPPTIDINAGSQFINDKGSFYNIQGSGDILGFEGRFSINKPNSRSHSIKRLTLNKKPNAPGETLTLGVNNISMGDIYAITDNLIFQGGEGSGINLQFGAIDVRSEFGKTIIEGEGTPGWEVELYKNGILVDFTQVDNSARYRFEEVAVEYGENIFDVRIYGPQGQKRNHRESVRVGDEMIPAGDNYAQISYAEVGNSLFNSFNNIAIEKKTHLQWKHGISDHLAAGLAFANKKTESASSTETENSTTNTEQQEMFADDVSYAELSLMGSFSALAMGVNAVHSDSNGWATALNGQTGINDISLSFLHKHYDDFISDRNRKGDRTNELEMRLNSYIKTESIAPVHYSFVLNHDSYHSAKSSTELENRMGFQVYSGMLTVNTTVHHLESQQNRLYGELNFSRALDRTKHLRTSLNYELHPKASLQTAALSLSWHPTSKIRTQMGLNLGLAGNSNDSLNLSASALFDAFTLSLTSESRENGYNSISFTFETSLGAESATQWSVSGNKRSDNGRVKIHTFLDQDEDGLHSKEDVPISGVKFTGRSSWSSGATNDEGILYLDNLNTFSPNHIKMNTASIDDPFWKPGLSEVNLVSHAGGVNQINIPVFITVEVEGSISLQRSDATRPIPGLKVFITNLEGEIVASTQTEFDGYYVIDGLKPGAYTLSFDNKALKRFHTALPQAIQFQANAEDGVVYIEPVVLR